MWASRRSDIEFTDHADLSHRGVDPSEFPKHLVFAGTTVERGNRAVGFVLLTMGLPYSLLGRLINFRPLGPLAAAAYRLVATNRRYIPAWIFPL